MSDDLLILVVRDDQGNIRDIGELIEESATPNTWAVRVQDPEVLKELKTGRGSQESDPSFVRLTASREEIAGLSFSVTLGALASHATSWVSISDVGWLDIHAKIASASAVGAVLEFTNATDPNTTPPGADDIVRPIATRLGGTALGGINEPSFGLPAQMLWARITVTDVTGGQDIDVSVEGIVIPPDIAQVPLITTLTDNFRAGIVKAALTGRKSDGDWENISVDADGDLFVASKQISDPGNSVTITSGSSSGHTPGTPFVGTAASTSARSIQETLTTVIALDASNNPISGLGGTFTFKYYPDDGNGNPGSPHIVETLPIRSFSTVRSFGWFSNAGDFYSVEFEPDRPLVAGETVVITTTHSKVAGNDFKRLSGQTLEKENQVLPINQSFLKGYDLVGDSQDLITPKLSDVVTGDIHALLVRSVNIGRQPDGDYENQRQSGSEPGNSSITLLPANDEFIGQWFDTTGFLGGLCLVYSDQPSADDGWFIEFTEDPLAVPVVVHRVTPGEYKDAHVGKGISREFPIAQGEYFRVHYINGAVGQNEFVLRTEIYAFGSQPPVGVLDGGVGNTSLATMTRSGLMAPDDIQEWGNIYRSAQGGLRTSVVEHEAETPIRSLPEWEVRLIEVGSANPVLAPAVLQNTRSRMFTNEGTGRVFLARRSGDFDLNRRTQLAAQETKVLEIDASPEVWLLADEFAGATLSDVPHSGVNASGTGSDPSNALASDDVNASVTANGQYVQVGDFSFTLTLDEITGVKIAAEMRKATTPTTETVTHQQTVDTTQSGGTSITSPSIQGGNRQCYVAVISNGNANPRAVGSVLGGGLTWVNVRSVIDSTNNNSLSVWRAVGSPASSFTVTANFTVGAVESSSIAVLRYSGVDQADPIQASVVDEAPGNATNSWSLASIAGTATTGQFIAAVNGRDRDPNFVSPTTLRSDVAVGADISTEVYDGAASASNVSSGNFANSTEWTAIALTLRPASATNPTVTLSYLVGGMAGATTSQIVLDSTTDNVFTVDVTGDRSWNTTNYSQLEVRVTGDDIGAAPARIDHIKILASEGATGATQPVSIVDIGEADD